MSKVGWMNVLTEFEAKQLEDHNLKLFSIDYKKNDFRYLFTDSKGEKHNIHLSFSKQENRIVINSYSTIKSEEVRVCISSLIQNSKELLVQKPKYRLPYISGMLNIYAPDEIIENLEAYNRHQDMVYVYHTYKETIMQSYQQAKQMIYHTHKAQKEDEAIELIFFGKDGLNLARVLARLGIISYEEKIKYLRYSVRFKDAAFGKQMEAVESFKQALGNLGFMIFWTWDL